MTEHHVQSISGREQKLVLGYLCLTGALLFVYFTNAKVKIFVDSWNEYLEGAIFINNDFFPPISVLDFAGALYCSLLYRQTVKGVKSWFEVLVSITFMQFGGSLLSNIFLLGQPPSWIRSRAAFPGCLLAWWLTFYCPYDWFYRFIHNNKPLLFINTYLVFLSIGHAVGSWGVDAAFKEYPQSYLLNIMVGSIVPCGGGVLLELLGIFRENSYAVTTTPRIFQVGAYGVSASLNRCFWMALIYYVLVSRNHSKADFVTAHSVMAILHTVVFLLIQHNISFDLFQYVSDEILETFEIAPAIHLGAPRETEEADDSEHEKSD